MGVKFNKHTIIRLWLLFNLSYSYACMHKTVPEPFHFDLPSCELHMHMILLCCWVANRMETSIAGLGDVSHPLLYTTLFIASCFILWRNAHREDNNTNTLQLMDHESYIMPTMPSITTLTKFKTRHNVIEQTVRVKLTEIIKQNPWLTGRLTRKFGSFAVELKYHQKPLLDIVDEHLSIISDVEGSTEMTYEQYLSSFHKYSVARGGECINNPNGRLFAVTILNSEHSNECYLVFSLSHMIADGFTFYQLYNMLDRDTPVRALEVTRSLHYESELVTLFGKEHALWHHNWYIPVGLLACSFFRPKMQGYVVKISNNWLQHQKKAFFSHCATPTAPSNITTPKVVYISTNDILTAWHNRVSGCNVHIMALNLRNRVPTYTDQLAGNYENSMIYNTPADGHTPEAVRQSLQTFRNASNTMPGVLKTLLWNGSLTTNWCSFYKQVDLSMNAATTKNDTVITTSNPAVDYKHIIHLPLMNPEEMSVWREFMCIFQLDNDNIGLLLYTRTLSAQQIEASGIGTVCTTL